MKKILFAVAALVCISLGSFAQGRFSVGGEVALPMGDFADFVGVGIGASGRYEAPINDNLSWMATTGFIYYTGKEVDVLGTTYDYNAIQIPVQGGLKYYFTESFNGFYAGAELGFHSTTLIVSSGGASGSDGQTDFSFAPSAGYHLGNLDISGRYQIVSDADYFGVRVAYVFGGK